MPLSEAGLLRTLCFYTTLGYAPTRAELMSEWDGGGNVEGGACHVMPLQDAFRSLIDRGLMVEQRGRCVLSGHEDLILEHERREALFSRKVRYARRAARWFARLSGVRFIALCNTTSLAHARDEADLDFVLITRAGTVWQTRAWSVFPFKLFRRRPHESHGRRDAVCLSFFLDDQHLDLSSLLLPDDVYFRHWFLSLLPLYDDGVGRAFWEANALILQRHPFARTWAMSPDLAVHRPRVRIPMVRLVEPVASRLQMRTFHPSIRAVMNRDTRVVVRDGVLKFHVEDGREAYREAYRALCNQYDVEA